MNSLLERLWGPSPGIVLTGHCAQHFSGLTSGSLPLFSGVASNKDMKIYYK